MIKRNSLLLIFIAIISSCGNKSFDTAEEISAYISDEENGYCFQKEVNGVNYSLKYKPTDLMVQQELLDQKDTNHILKLKNKYKDNLYFTLSMSSNGKELLNDVVGDKYKFELLLNDLVFKLKDKVYLHTKKDTLEIIDVVYPRLYGMSKSTTVLIVYPRNNDFLRNEIINFTIDDLGFNTGEVKFKIETKYIINEPQLNFRK
ncbi:MAG: hypothetical protein LRY32_04055 [Flavobacterium sp.]|nr:hypothetical protein [Flavobacterium sp.]